MQPIVCVVHRDEVRVVLTDDEAVEEQDDVEHAGHEEIRLRSLGGPRQCDPGDAEEQVDSKELARRFGGGQVLR